MNRVEDIDLDADQRALLDQPPAVMDLEVWMGVGFLFGIYACAMGLFGNGIAGLFASF